MEVLVSETPRQKTAASDLGGICVWATDTVCRGVIGISVKQTISESEKKEELPESRGLSILKILSGKSMRIYSPILALYLVLGGGFLVISKLLSINDDDKKAGNT
jgi:hypothetical protein